MQRAFAVFWVPSGFLGFALGRPPQFLAPDGEVRGDALGIFISMQRKVFRLGHQSKIAQSIIGFVFVDVVQDHPPRNLAIHRLPNDVSAKTPHIGLRNLHVSALFTSALVSGSDPNGPQRCPVLRDSPRQKLPRFVSHVGSVPNNLNRGDCWFSPYCHSMKTVDLFHAAEA
jgi:hypothetical protein